MKNKQMLSLLLAGCMTAAPVAVSYTHLIIIVLVFMIPRPAGASLPECRN